MRILYVATISSTVNAFLCRHILMLLELGHKVDIACNITKPINKELIDSGCNIFNISFQRDPIKRENYRAFRDFKKIIEENNYDMIHTHTPVASVCARLATIKNKKIKVLYTAHGFHFYKGAPLKNWIIYYPIEVLLSRYTDVIITINQEDFERAKKFSKKCKVYLVPGVGIDLTKVSLISIDRDKKRKEFNLPDDAFVLLSIGELNSNKNHHSVIKALSLIKKNDMHYFICGTGPKEDYLKELIKSYGLERQVHLLGYRNDIIEICKASDIFVFPSFREGLPVSVMEAAACSLPIICSNIRGNTEIVDNKKGGYTVEPRNILGFSESIIKLYEDKMLRKKFGFYNKEKVKQFEVSLVKDKLKYIYDVNCSCKSEGNYIL